MSLGHGPVASIPSASAARTAQTDSANQTNRNARGVHLILNVTAASGTGGLQVRLLGVDPISSTVYALAAAPTAITATGISVYELYPGAAAAAA